MITVSKLQNKWSRCNVCYEIASISALFKNDGGYGIEIRLCDKCARDLVLRIKETIHYSDNEVSE